MMALQPPSAADARAARSGLVLLSLLGAGALGIVLAGTESSTFELDRFSVPKELVLNGTALIAVLVLATGWRRLRATVPELLLGAFAAWSVVSAVLAANRWISFRSVALTISGFIVFLAARRISDVASAADPFATWLPVSNGRRDALLAILAIAVAIGAGTGVLQAYGLDLPGLAEERAPGGAFGNRNFLAHLTAIGLPVVALCALRARNRATLVLWTLMLAVCGNAIILTRSRAGWLGAAAAALVALAGYIAARSSNGTPIRTSRRLIVTIAAVGIGGVTALVVPNTLQWTSDAPYAETLTRLTDYRGGSGRGRLIQYGNSLDLVARNPVFGTGPGNWFIEYPLVTTPGDPSFAGAEPIPTNPWPSSDWVALLTERGPVGLALVLATGAAILLIALRRLRDPDPSTTLDAIALLALLAATVVTGAFDAVLLNAAPIYFVAAATGLLLPRSGDVLDRPLSGRTRSVLAALLIALSLGATSRSAQQLAAIMIVENDGTSRISMERALEFDPPNHRLHLRLGARDCAHARAAQRLMPFHEVARRAAARCGQAGRQQDP